MNIKLLNQTILAATIATGSFFSCFPVQAIEIEQQTFCQLTVQESEQEKYTILVPQAKVRAIVKKLKIVGINCRNQSLSTGSDSGN